MTWDGQNVLEVRNLCAAYGEKVIITDVSFDVPKGQIVCLIGGSGCGKSTTFRAAVGLLEPRAGEVRLFGEEINKLDDLKRAQLLGRVGMLFQNGALLSSMTIGENIALPLKEHTDLPYSVIERIVAAKLALVNLPDTAHLMPAELSGGMRKRAALARALALDPEVLLCDEPSAGLDPVVAAGIDETLRSLQRTLGMTIVVVTHELASIELIADQLVMLRPGGYVVEIGTLQQLKQSDDPLVQEFFGRHAPADKRHAGPSLLEALTQTGGV